MAERGDNRIRVETHHHYEIEKRLAARLRDASRDARRELYTAVYDELYRSVPNHPQLVRKADAEERTRHVAIQLRVLDGLLKSQYTFLEIGPGDCSLVRQLATRVRLVYAVDISEEITADSALPDNCKLLISDGCSIPAPEGSVDVAYSNQVMEHLHPDDAHDQLKNIYTVLKPGGSYVCITPNRLNGPHDVSKDFDDVATGFHLKEYSNKELASLFREVGFAKVRRLLWLKGAVLSLPVALFAALEDVLLVLPARIRSRIARWAFFDLLLGIKLVGTKPSVDLR